MDVERRAQHAFDKGEPVRAVVMLAEHLKREPSDEHLLEPLFDYYLEGVETPGLERDVAEALVGVDGGEAVASSLVVELERGGQAKRLEALERAVEAVDLEVSVGVAVTSEVEGAEVASGEEPAGGPSGGGTEVARRPVRGGGREDGAGEPKRSGDGEERDEAIRNVGGPAGSGSPGGEPRPEGGRDDDYPGSTEEGERERSQVTSEEERTEPGAGPPGDGRDVEADRSASRRGVVAAIVVAGLLGAGYAIWRANTPGPKAALDRALERFDATAPDDVRSSLQRAKQVVGRVEGLRERGEFVDALVALRSGETMSFEREAETPWGRAARAGAALTRGDIESAVRYERELERRRADTRLPREWAGARVAEARGKLARARADFRAARREYPEFEPFVAGVVRTAAAAMDRPAFERASDRLDEQFPGHPYLADRTMAFPDVWTADRVEVREELDDGTPWNASMRRYRLARRAAHSGRCERTLELTDEILETWKAFGPAMWLRGVCGAAEFDVSAANDAFGRLVEADELATEYRWRLQATAPAVLTRAGRPDLAAKYLLAGTEPVRVPESGPVGEGESAGGAATVVTRTGHWSEDLEQSTPEDRWRTRAALARVETLAALGLVGRAKSRLDEIDASKVSGWRRSLAAAQLDVVRGEHPVGRSEWARRRASSVERIVAAFHEGRPARAREQVRSLAEGAPEGGPLLRYLTLTDAESGRVRRARTQLQERRVAPVYRAEVARLEARIRARLEAGSEEMPERCRRFRETAPTSGQAATDLAACLLWSGRVEAADDWSGRATRLHGKSPATNWMRGIVLRALGRGDRAEQYLARSWRSDRGGSRLDLELGVVNVALGNWERARDLFREALYKQPGNVRAIRRLGRTYMRIDADEGRWNFERLLEGYQRRDGRRLQAAEVHRWLGIFEGSRDGEGGWDHLQRARELVGRRRAILVEMGRYREAREEWKEAKSRYLDVLERDATSPEAHLGLARVAAGTGESQTMETHLQQYLELRPRGERAAWAREQLEQVESGGPDDGSEE